MKKFSAVVLLILLVSSAAATSIESETVTVDLADSTAEVEVDVNELSQTAFTYITVYPKDNVHVEIDGEQYDCDIRKLSVGSEIRCPTDKREDFTVNLEFSLENIVNSQEDAEMFQYTYSVYRPTNEYNFRVILPSGAEIIDENNLTTPTISPDDYNMDTEDGRIYLEWSTDPGLGETLDYRVAFNDTSLTLEYLNYLLPLVTLGLIIGILHFYRKDSDAERVEEVYGELKQDQVEILELIKINDGRMLQKDIVSQSSYSKAKISGVVSELEEKGIINKTKEGRSNQIKLSEEF